MKGYINVRITPIGLDRIGRSIVHDYRKKKSMRHVDYKKSGDNFHSHSEEELRSLIAKYREEHKPLYLKRYKRNLRSQYTHSIRMGIVTFPRIYQLHYENGLITKQQLLDMFENFKRLYEKRTGGKIFASVSHFDEDVFHHHFYSTNYHTTTGQTLNSKDADELSILQEIGGESHASIGLQRGINKRFTKAKNKDRREHYESILNQSDIIEHYLTQPELKKSIIDSLIKDAVPPLKTMLTYTKRALDKDAAASKILQNQERALNKMKDALPNIQSMDDFEQLVDYIIQNQKQIRAQNFVPTRK